MKYNEQQLVAVLGDSSYQDIGQLPSGFIPYTERYLSDKAFDKIYIRPLTVKELKLISKSAVLKSLDPLIRAVDAVITQDINLITQEDFYYILAWLRLFSTPKKPDVVNWDCPASYLKNKETGEIIFNDETFVQPENPDDYDIVPCKTGNTELIYQKDLKVINLEEDNFDGLPEGFDFPRVGNLVELNELMLNDEYYNLLPAVQWIVVPKDFLSSFPKDSPQAKIKAGTLEEKLAFLEEQKDLDLFEEALALNKSIVYGISESTILHCRTCRAVYPHSLLTTAASFFQ